MSTSINLIANSSVLASAWVCVAQVAGPPCPCQSEGGCSGMSLRAFLGGSLEAFGASWEHICAQPGNVWPCEQLQWSLRGGAWPARWSILPWITLFNARLIPLAPSPRPPSSKCPRAPHRYCSSPVASSPSQRSRRHLATPLNDLRLGKHLTERVPFQIWDCILLFQYLGTSEWPWLLRQQVKLAKHPPSVGGEQRPGWLRESRERQHTAKAKRVKCLVFCLAPFRPYGRLCPHAFGHGEEEMSEEGTDIRLTRKWGQICCYATLICLTGISNQLCFTDCREMKLTIVSV